MTIAEFLHMDGYALYVWGAYGVTLAVLALNVILARQQRRKALRAILRVAQRDRSRA
jgi:heme exporter protein D